MPLNERQQRFVDAYLKDPNGTRAAIRAGYAKSGAATQAIRLLRNDKVRDAIMERSVKIREKADIDAAWVLSRLKNMLSVRDEDLVDEDGNIMHPRDWPDGAQYLVSGFETTENYEWVGSGKTREKLFLGYTRKVKLESRLKALELAGRHIEVQAWLDKHQHDQKRPMLIRINHRAGTEERVYDGEGEEDEEA